MRTALALSPHLDDAVFSAGGTLADLAARGDRVIVATVFTRSVADPQGFALACQLDKGLAPEVDYMALRRDEDAAACRALGAESRWLPFAEAPHRGYGSAPALFAGLHDADGIVAELAPALRALVEDVGPDLILAPQAIGAHVDHCALVLALDLVDLDRVAARAQVLWWRDYPYVERSASPPQPFRERFDAMAEQASRLDGARCQAKLDAALCYRSQLGFQFGGPDALRARWRAADPVEYFRTAAPTSSATA